jgi:hypothetical protein
MIEELGDRLAAGVTTMKNLRRVEQDLHAFISEDVKLELTHRDPLNIQWASAQGQQMIEQLVVDAYGQLE